MPKLKSIFVNEQGVVHLLVPMILLVGIIAGTYLVLEGPKIFKPKAYEARNSVSGPVEVKFSPCPPIGDVDNNGYVTNADADAVLKIVAKLDPYKNPTADQLTRANVDTRNNNVTSVDSLMIKRYVAGLDNTFRACTPQASPSPSPSASPSPTATPIPTSTPYPSSTPQAAVKRVFITSTAYNGNLKTAGSNVGLGAASSGLDGADKICQSRANAVSLGGTWKAWLSDSTTSAASRLNHSNGSYKLLNGTLVASNWSDLITTDRISSDFLLSPINVNERNVLVTERAVWTNANTDGSIWNTAVNNGSCGGTWNVLYNNGVGRVGLSSKANLQWTTYADLNCSQSWSTAALYCFEQ